MDVCHRVESDCAGPGHICWIVSEIRVVRGAVIEWLERLAVVRKVTGSSPALAKRLENSHCPPSSEWVPDQLQGRFKAAKGKDWAPPFTCRAQDTMGL